MTQEDMDALERSIMESDEDRALEAYASERAQDMDRESDLDSELETAAEKLVEDSDGGDLDSELDALAEKKMNEPDELDEARIVQKEISYTQAFVKFWKSGFKMQGRASRAEFWKAYLVNCLIGLILYSATIIPAIQGSAIAGTVVMSIFLLYSFAFIVSSITMTVRRLHDIGKSGWNFFVSCIPLAGPIIMFIWLIKPSVDSDVGERKGLR